MKRNTYLIDFFYEMMKIAIARARFFKISTQHRTVPVQQLNLLSRARHTNIGLVVNRESLDFKLVENLLQERFRYSPLK